MQLISRYGGCGDVVTPLHDDPWNVGQSASTRNQLTFGEPAAMKKVMILDAGESQREGRITEIGNQTLIRLKSDGGSLPGAPSDSGRPVHSGVGVKQQVVVSGDGVTGKGATAQRSEEHFVALGEQLPGGTVVVEIQLAPSECEDSAQHQLRDAVTVLFRVRQGERAAPRATKNLPTLDATMHPQPLDVCNQVPGGVGAEIGFRFAGMGLALATATLIEKHDVIARGVKQTTHLGIQPSPGPTMQEDCRFA